MTRNEIMDFKFGRSIQIAILIALAFPCVARAQQVVSTRCEDKVVRLLQPPFSKDDNTSVTVAGTVISFTVPNRYLDTLVKIFGDEKRRADYKSWGCTEALFVSAKNGKILKHIDLGPAEPKVTADESSKSAVSPVEQIEETTAENINKLLDLSIGFHRRELAVIQKLQTWYEVDPDHADAVALRKEFCANLTTTGPTERLLAVLGIEPKDDARVEKAAEVMVKSDELREKRDRDLDLVHKITSALGELKGMGFGCGQ